MDLHLILQTCLYVFLFVFGFVISIPIGAVKSSFGGECPLYAETKMQSTDHFKTKFRTGSNCDFPIYFSVFGLILYCCGMLVYYGYCMFKGRKDPDTGSKMFVLPFLVLGCAIWFLTLVAACIISVGFGQLCGGLVDAVETYSKEKYNKGVVLDCVTFQDSDWTINGVGENTGKFHRHLKAAEAGAWLAFVGWTVQVGLTVLRFLRNKRGSSAGSKSRASADKEKQGNVEGLD